VIAAMFIAVWAIYAAPGQDPEAVEPVARDQPGAP
jgi:hypothetical protein